MSDITALPISELLGDRKESVADIAVCMKALKLGITHHRDGFLVKQRLDDNHEIIDRIDEELRRRGFSRLSEVIAMEAKPMTTIPINQLTLETPYHCRVRRSGKHAIVTCYGQNGHVDRVKGTDPNCFSQSVHDYDFLEPVQIPTSVFDALSTARIDAVVEVERSEVTR